MPESTGPDPISSGQISWEATRSATGEVLGRGRRDLRPSDFEVFITPGRPAPRPGDLRHGPSEVVSGLFSWLVWRGRGRSSKRIRLGAGFWLVLSERPGPTLPLGMALQAERDGEDTFCWEWFDSDATGTTATKLQETGSLRLELGPDPDGNHEVLGTTFATDVSLRVRGRGDRDRERPRYRVRVLTGSVVRWPRTADGVKLLPRLRPDLPPRA